MNIWQSTISLFFVIYIKTEIKDNTEPLLNIKNNFFLLKIISPETIIKEATIKTITNTGPISYQGKTLSLPNAITVEGIPLSQSEKELTYYLGLDPDNIGTFILPHNDMSGLSVETIIPFEGGTLLSINSTTINDTTLKGPVTVTAQTFFLDTPLLSTNNQTIIGKENTTIHTQEIILSGNTSDPSIFVSDNANTFSLEANTLTIDGKTTITGSLIIDFNTINTSTLSGITSFSGLPKNEGKSKTLIGYDQGICYAFTPSGQTLEADNIGEITNQVGSDLIIYGGKNGINISGETLFITGGEGIGFEETTECALSASQKIQIKELIADQTNISGQATFGGNQMNINYIETENKNNTFPAKQVLSLTGKTIIFDTNHLSPGFGFTFLTSHTPEKLTTGTYLVLNDNKELYKIASSSERYKENIMPFLITKEDFITYFTLISFTPKESNEVYLGINPKKLAKSPFHEILEKTDDGKNTHSFQETALMACAATQKDIIESEIAFLEEDLVALERLL